MIRSALALTLLALLLAARVGVAGQPRPNIVWLTSEDHGPHLGCYGDRYATTPSIDALAARGVRYARAWSNAPVCAPARTTLISGLYANSTGAEHMRSMVPYPAGLRMFPAYLRDVGYYCTNNAKTDYNLQTAGEPWDASGRAAHWSAAPAGVPFFAVFNSTSSHESQIRKRPHQQVHDPAAVPIPPYHPDTPEVRRDWAQYYDVVTQADADAGRRLQELEQAGLADDTIVFYFADHGSGMPRSKRWPYNSGLHVPLVVYIPAQFAHLRPADYAAGAAILRLVSLVDFAPTVLSLAGVQPPAAMQGRALLGPYAQPAGKYLFGFRGRMDERIDLVRSVTDGRYVYVRNFMPHRIYGQHLSYMFQTPTTQVWHRLHLAGALNPVQDAFWNVKPVEELYDLQDDPHETDNLAQSAQHRDTRDRLRQALRDHLLDIRDVGFLPEGEMHARAAGASPYDMARDDTRYPLRRILETAELAADRDASSVAELAARAGDADAAVRYWSVLGLLVRGRSAVESARSTLESALDDPSPEVQIAAAEALCLHAGGDARRRALAVLSNRCDPSRNNVFVAVAALNAVEACGPRAANLRAKLANLAASAETPHARYDAYVGRLIESLKEPGISAQSAAPSSRE